MEEVRIPYLRVLDDTSSHYGGNQSWDPKKAVRKSACGPVAATGLICYVQGENEIERDEFMQKFTKLRRVYFPILPYLGSSGISIAAGLNVYFMVHRMPYHARWCISGRRMPQRIETMLSLDIPVILCIGNHMPKFWKNGKLKLYQKNPDGTMRVYTKTSAHFVTVTEMDDTWMTVSSWGKKLYISREEWKKYVRSCSCSALSNIVYIRKCGTKK